MSYWMDWKQSQSKIVYDRMERSDSVTIEVPDWCVIGKTIEWYAPHITGIEWVRDKIISFGYDGFFHQGHNCPVYYTKFSEYGKTVKEMKD